MTSLLNSLLLLPDPLILRVRVIDLRSAPSRELVGSDAVNKDPHALLEGRPLAERPAHPACGGSRLLKPGGRVPRRLSRRGLCLGALLVLGSHTLALAQASPSQASTLAALRSGFMDPPPPARLRCYWWWLNGNTDAATITHDLEEMKGKGFGGALLVDANGASQEKNRAVPTGPRFGSPAWTALFTHALAEADHMGLEITLNITSGWNLGGPDVKPEQATKLLTWTRTSVRGGRPLTVTLAAPETRRGFYRQIAVLAYPLAYGSAAPSGGRSASDAKAAAAELLRRSAGVEAGFSMPDTSSMLDPGPNPDYFDTSLSAVRDLTSAVDSAGRLSVDLPPGDWEILRVGYTASDARVSTSSDTWQGLALDYLSREAFNQYWDANVEPLLAAARPFHSLRYLATDSWELGGANWTADFREQFLRLRGYDPVPWLAVVAGRTVENAAQSARFLTDLRRTVADLVVERHYDVFAQRAAEHGLGVQAESGGPHGAPLDALETFRHAAIPQTEFWSQNPHRSSDGARFFTKEGASAANIYGHPLVAQEGETSIGPQWSESLATDLKPSFDMAVTEGMNRLVWHEFTSSPAATGLPGQEYFAGTHLNPKVTWWNAGTAFFEYLNRVQFMVQQGVPVDDVLYFYGDNVPNFVRLKADDPAMVLPGYDYDVTNEDALLHTIRVDGATLVGRGGVRWRVLAMPKTRRVSFAVLELTERFLAQGGAVAGPVPTSTTGRLTPAEQVNFDAAVHRIWSGCLTGTGGGFCSTDTRAALGKIGLPPDFTVLSIDGSTVPAAPASSSAGIDYVHRRLDQTEVYFLRNAWGHAVRLTAAFRASTLDGAELWDAVSGRRSGLRTLGSLPDGRVTVELGLPAFGSSFVLFDPACQAPEPSFTTRTVLLTNSWSVTFQAGRGAPVDAQTMTALGSWTESSNPGIRFFSGSAVYRADIEAPSLPAGGDILLSFTNIREIARIRVNGQEAGTLWAMPYALSVGKLLRPGLNRIEIEVTNLWPNRIIGDQQPGAGKPFTTTNITAYRADSPLLASGLIGPVQWLIRSPEQR